MKTSYDIKDQVWIHIGERKLTPGRIVEIIDLAHLNENHDPDRELYIIEIKTGIDDVYEVRDFEQISPDEQGPINLFRKHNFKDGNRLLKKVGMPVPQGVMEFEDYPEPTPDEIHAAMERSQAASQHAPLNTSKAPKKKYYAKRKPKA